MRPRVTMVKGPAIVKVIGQCSCLGCRFSDTTVTVKTGKVLPFEIRRGSKIGITLEDCGTFWTASPYLAGTSMWKSVAMKLVQMAETKKGFAILVVGNSDAGKTTFCTFLANTCIDAGIVPCIIDADVGQSDLAPPGTIGTASLKSQMTDLRNLETPKTGFGFVGSISPAGFEDVIINRAKTAMQAQCQLASPDIFIVNTDGYVSDAGIPYKLRMADELQVKAVICLGRTVLSSIFKRRTQSIVIRVRSSPFAIKSRPERIARRIEQYARFIGTACAVKQFADTRLVYRGQELRTADLANFGAGTFVGVESNHALIGFGCLNSQDSDSMVIRTDLQGEKFDSVLLSDILINDTNSLDPKTPNDVQVESVEYLGHESH